MKKMAWGLALASLTFTGAAAAGDLADRRDYEPGSYSAQLYYRVDFGANRGQAQSLGLRFDSERAAAAGAPSLMQARFGAHGIDRLTLSGMELRGPSVAANQTGGGFFSSLTATQWVALIFTTVVLGTVAIDATEESDDEPSGTGGT
jgi:hypothetical protein